MSARGIGSVRVFDILTEKWGVDENTLYELAKQNTPRLMRKFIQPVGEVLEKHGYDIDPDEEIPLYIVSNESGVNGAVAILYPEQLSVVSETIGA